MMTALTVGGVLTASAGAAELRHVILRLNFTPWGMHAPYYAAQQQGFYKAEGLDVEIRPASSGQQNEVFVGTGREQFGISNADSVIKARSSGVPVVAVMADQPDSPFSIISLKSENITKPADFKGKKLAWIAANVKTILNPLLHSAGMTLDDINFVNVTRGAEVQMLAAGGVDGLFGYAFGQALTLDMKGFPTNVMALKDYGLNVYGTVVYTNEDLLKSHPDVVKAFIRGTLKGYIWTKSHMDEAMNYVIKVAPDRHHDLEVKKLKIIYGLYNSPDYAKGFGMMNDAKWASSINVLGGELAKKPKPSDMYTNAILEQLPEAKQFEDMLKAK